MIVPISWTDISFFAFFLIPDLFWHLSVKDSLNLCFLAIPYGAIPNVRSECSAFRSSVSAHT